MARIILFCLIAVTIHQALSEDVAICQICKNEECYSKDGIHYNSFVSTCTPKLMKQAHEAINEGYHQNYAIPETAEEFVCVDIRTKLVLPDNLIEYFTYKGCIEKGFNVRTVEPNPSYFKGENREIFKTCNEKQCNQETNIVIGPKPVLSCFTCVGEADCNAERLDTVQCKNNYVDTYYKLSDHYGIDYRPLHNVDYECFTINSTLTGSKNSSQLIYKGCVEKGFDSCLLNFNRTIYDKEEKQHCRTCPYDKCNRMEKAAKPLTCYYCDGPEQCKEENWKNVTCAANYGETYEKLSKHYQMFYQPTHELDHECFSISSNLTGFQKDSQFVYKGCVEKGFKACSIPFNTNYYKKETKQFCKTCGTELCNGAGILRNSLVVLGLAIAALLKVL